MPSFHHKHLVHRISECTLQKGLSFEKWSRNKQPRVNDSLLKQIISNDFSIISSQICTQYYKKKKSKITIWTLYLQILMWPFPIWIYWLCQVKHGRRLCVQPSSVPSFCTFCLHGDRQEESRSLLIVRMRNSLFRFLRWVQLRFVEVISQLKDNAIQNLIWQWQ